MLRRVLLLVMIGMFCSKSAVEAREWTDTSNNSIDGDFQWMEEGNLVIKTAGGLVAVPFHRLSNVDQNFLRANLSRQGISDILPAANARPSQLDPVKQLDEPRVWQDNVGGTYDGKFENVAGQDVLIRGESRIFRVPFAKLTREYQELVRKALESRSGGDLTPAINGDDPRAGTRQWSPSDDASFVAKFRRVVLADDQGRNAPMVVLQGRKATIVRRFDAFGASDQSYVRGRLRDLDQEDLLDNEATPPDSPTTPLTNVRNWTHSGSQRVSGEFVGLDTIHVEIRSTPGARATRILFASLSPSDQDFARTEAEQRDPVPAANRPVYRVWTISTSEGEDRVLARYDSQSGDTIVLRQIDRTVRIDVSRLSAEDHDHIRQVGGQVDSSSTGEHSAGDSNPYESALESEEHDDVEPSVPSDAVDDDGHKPFFHFDKTKKLPKWSLLIIAGAVVLIITAAVLRYMR